MVDIYHTPCWLWVVIAFLTVVHVALFLDELLCNRIEKEYALPKRSRHR